MSLRRELPPTGGVIFEREVQGAHFHVFGASTGIYENVDRVVSPAEDAVHWMKAFANDAVGKRILNTLSDEANYDFNTTEPGDLLVVRQVPAPEVIQELGHLPTIPAVELLIASRDAQATPAELLRRQQALAEMRALDSGLGIQLQLW